MRVPEKHTADALLQRIYSYRSVLVGRGRRLGVNRDDAEDLAQEAIIKAWMSREQFIPNAQGNGLTGWLYTIHLNCFRSRLRHEHLQQRTLDTAQVFEPTRTDCMGAATLDAEHLLERVYDLPEHQRQVVVAVVLVGDSYADAAKRLNLPFGTVKSRMARAREALQA